MLMVGTVSVNRVRADCLDFGDIRTVSASKGAVKRQQKAMISEHLIKSLD